MTYGRQTAEDAVRDWHEIGWIGGVLEAAARRGAPISESYLRRHLDAAGIDPRAVRPRFGDRLARSRRVGQVRLLSQREFDALTAPLPLEDIHITARVRAITERTAT